jgi:hypothetical protein
MDRLHEVRRALLRQLRNAGRGAGTVGAMTREAVSLRKRLSSGRIGGDCYDHRLAVHSFPVPACNQGDRQDEANR